MGNNIKKNKIIVIVGFSNTGKDSVSMKIAKEHGYNFIISTTTRPIREYESQKNPYNFVGDEEFQKLIKNDMLIEYRAYNALLNNIPSTWYYGVENKEVDPSKDYIVVLDIVGLRGFKEKFKDNIISFFLEADEDTRKQRCINRGDFNEFEWNRRLEDDKTRFTKEIIYNELDFVVDSYNIEETAKEIMDCIKFAKEKGVYNNNGK